MALKYGIYRKVQADIVRNGFEGQLLVQVHFETFNSPEEAKEFIENPENGFHYHELFIIEEEQLIRGRDF